MSLGAGHVWRTVEILGAVQQIECAHCGRSRDTRVARSLRHVKRRNRGMRFSSFRFFHGRPLGTCPEVARRRAAGEAEIRATLAAFE